MILDGLLVEQLVSIDIKQYVSIESICRVVLSIIQKILYLTFGLEGVLKNLVHAPKRKPSDH